ncbi:hypothetical protein [Sphingomonas ursincola]|uniref:hypothetical protein n=1 Tax=Sphingomonas ursincola TaxID=56361 RepID=UPI002356DC38|nr:hypothetical protein [Sphingomonas ursincola]MBY0618435.1 hypothetical protein [Sphingomonas ursincola]
MVEHIDRDAADKRPDDDALLPYLPDHIQAARRCGLEKSEWLTGWFVSWSPRNDNQNAEGCWSDWVALANAILDADRKATAALSAAADHMEAGDAN